MSPLLALAVDQGSAAMVGDLLGAGGTDFRRDTLGEALLLASQNGHERFVALLLSLEAPVSWRGVEDRTPLALAAIGGHDRCVRLLLAAGASVDAVDNGGWTATHLASGEHQPAVVALLAEFGADPDAPGPSGTRPLTIAVRNATPGIRIRSKFRMDETGFEAQLVLTDPDPAELLTVRVLLDSGADINATDDRGRTTLHYAASKLQPAMVSELLTRGANAAIRDNEGETAYKLAQSSMAAPQVLLGIRADAVLNLLEVAAAGP